MTRLPVPHWEELPDGALRARHKDLSVLIVEAGDTLRVKVFREGVHFKTVSSFDTLHKTKRLASILVSTA